MQKAVFSIIKYHFEKVSIDLLNNTSKEINLNFETSGLYNQANSSFDLTFSVSAFNKDTPDKVFAYVKCVGTFQFDDVNSMEEIPDFFYRNSIAILFPFVRAYVSMITTQANVPGIMLPTLNLTSLEETLKQHTTQQ
jgi:preprotein translocase subunit SecB